MEAILFFKELKSKGNGYFELWLPLLMQFDDSESQVITLKMPVGMPKTSYYRALAYGVEIFPKYVTGFTLEKNRNGLVLNRSNGVYAAKKIEQPIMGSIVVVNPEVDKPKRRSPKPIKIADSNVYDEIIDYLNECSGKEFKKDNKSTITLINSRLKEGYKLEDFKKVIAIKCTNWLGNKMETYIRPLTLFSSKFESYINEIVIVEKSKQQKAYDTVTEATELGWNNGS